MGLDVYLQTEEKRACPNCGYSVDRLVQTTLFHGKITHNLADMAEESGLYEILWRPEELKIVRAKGLIKGLTEGLQKLLDDPIKFQKYNPENGWGSYSDLVKLVKNYLAACKENPDALIWVDR